MKKLLLMSLLFLFGSATFAQSQQVLLKFVGQGTDGTRIQMEYVEVKNLAGDSALWTENLAWPDTILYMTMETDTTSIHNYVNEDGFAFVPMGANPFYGKTEVALQMQESGNVRLNVYDIAGKEVVAFNANLPKGVHHFQICVSQTQTYLVSAQCGTKRASIKLVNVGHDYGNAISYSGMDYESIVQPKMELLNSYHAGDKLECTGYVHIADSLYASDVVTLMMDSLDTLETVVLTFPIELVKIVTWIPDSITENCARIGMTAYVNDTTVNAPFTEKGIVWANHANVTIEDNVISAGDTLGEFATLLTPLEANTPYFVRAYAITDIAGTIYGDEYVLLPMSQLRDNQPCAVATVTDANGNTYNTVRIGRQCWTRENLRTIRYNDTMDITNVADLVDTYIFFTDSAFRDTVVTFTYDTTVIIDSIIIPYDTSYVFHFDTSSTIRHIDDTYFVNDMSITDVDENAVDQTIDGAVDSLVSYFTFIATADSVGHRFIVYDDTVTVNGTLPASVKVFVNVTVDTLAASDYSDSLAYRYDTLTVFFHADKADTIQLIDSLVPHFTSLDENPMESSYLVYEGALMVDGASDFAVKAEIEVAQIDTIIVRHSDTLKLVDHITTTYISTHNGYVAQHDTTFYYEVVWPADTLDHIVIDTIADTAYLFSGIDTLQIDTIHYSDYSDMIPYCYYPDSSATAAEAYGLLYNYMAASIEGERSFAEPSGIRGICPAGWHIPAIGEWEQLTNYLESQRNYHAGDISTNIAKALAAQENWLEDTVFTYSIGNTPMSNNATGFSTLPAGSYADSTGAYARFWSCSGEQPTAISVFRLDYNLPGATTDMLAPDAVASVRCVRDVEEVADGFACPGTPAVTDVEGNVYNTIMIGGQCWMKENLRTRYYADHTALVQGEELSDSVAYYYLPSVEESELSLYGILYNWSAVMGGQSSSASVPSNVQGICPDGWHVPNQAEWLVLNRYVGSQAEYRCGSSSNSIGKALAGTYGWRPSSDSCDTGDTTTVHNATGFSALPAGRYPNNATGVTATFWSSTESNDSQAVMRYLNYTTPNFSKGDLNKSNAASVRCVKD